MSNWCNQITRYCEKWITWMLSIHAPFHCFSCSGLCLLKVLLLQMYLWVCAWACWQIDSQSHLFQQLLSSCVPNTYQSCIPTVILTRKLPSKEVTPTLILTYHMTFNPLQAMLMSYSHVKDQGQMSVGLNDTMDTNTVEWMDACVEAIALCDSLKWFLKYSCVLQ